jgi:excisionase family DNA binding protein
MSAGRSERRGWSPHEVAAQLGLSPSFVRKEIRLGRLRSCKLGRRVVILSIDLDNYLHQSGRNRRGC